MSIYSKYQNKYAQPRAGDIVLRRLKKTRKLALYSTKGCASSKQLDITLDQMIALEKKRLYGLDE